MIRFEEGVPHKLEHYLDRDFTGYDFPITIYRDKRKKMLRPPFKEKTNSVRRRAGPGNGIEGSG